jgi:hypothetical protein
MSSSIIAWKPSCYTREQSSARLRCYQPIDYLRSAGWQCELFDRTQMHRYRVVIFQKSYTPEDLDIAAHLRGLGARTVFDLCDNHFVGPAERAERLRRMVDSVDTVTVSTAELAEAINRPCTVIDDALDCVEPTRWPALRRWWPRRGTLRLAWFGNAGQDDPPFGLIDLARIRPRLEALHARRPIRVTVISNSRAQFDRHLSGVRFPIEYHDWENRGYQSILQRQDLCLIPISPNPYTLCKSVNRLALALMLGLPVIADPIPSYEELRPFAVIGDWETGLTDYVNDRRRQRRDVRLGQSYLRAKFTPSRVVEQWSGVLRAVAA